MYNRGNRKRFFVFIPLLVAGIILLLGGVVMLLWNAILPAVVNAGALSYWQAIGLLVLSRILFGGFGGKRCGKSRFNGGGHLHEKWKNMSEEERRTFKEQWRRRCGRTSAAEQNKEE